MCACTPNFSELFPLQRSSFLYFSKQTPTIFLYFWFVATLSVSYSYSWAFSTMQALYIFDPTVYSTYITQNISCVRVNLNTWGLAGVCIGYGQVANQVCITNSINRVDVCRRRLILYPYSRSVSHGGGDFKCTTGYIIIALFGN